MSEEKWTRGEWIFEPAEDNVSIDEPACGGSIMSGDTHIARVWNDVSDNEEEYIANGNILSAASDIYKALAAVEWIEEIGENVRFCPECRRYEAFGHYPECKLNAALKKARG